MEQLDRDLAAESGVSRGEYGAHPATSQFADDLVLSDPRAERGQQRLRRWCVGRQVQPCRLVRTCARRFHNPKNSAIAGVYRDSIRLNRSCRLSLFLHGPVLVTIPECQIEIGLRVDGAYQL